MGVPFLSLLYECIDKSKNNFLNISLNKDGALSVLCLVAVHTWKFVCHWLRNPYRLSVPLSSTFSIEKDDGNFEIS